MLNGLAVTSNSLLSSTTPNHQRPVETPSGDYYRHDSHKDNTIIPDLIRDKDLLLIIMISLSLSCLINASFYRRHYNQPLSPIGLSVIFVSLYYCI